MSLDRFELLELRRDDGIQTFHAREIATARPVQVHLFVNGTHDAVILTRLERLPAAERRRVIDRGVSADKAYVVTDRLAGFASFREWVNAKATDPSIDMQFHQLFESPTIPEAGPKPALDLEPEPLPVSAPEPSPESAPQQKRPALAFAAKALLAVVLGVAAALALLAVAIAVFAFHRW